MTEWWVDVVDKADLLLSSSSASTSVRACLEESGLDSSDVNSLKGVILSAVESGDVTDQETVRGAIRALEAVRWTVGQMLHRGRLNFAALAFLDSCREPSECTALQSADIEQNALKALRYAKVTFERSDATEALKSDAVATSLGRAMRSRLRRAFLVGVALDASAEHCIMCCEKLLTRAGGSRPSTERWIQSRRALWNDSPQSSALDDALRSSWRRARERSLGLTRAAFAEGRVASAAASAAEGDVKRAAARTRKRRERSEKRHAERGEEGSDEEASPGPEIGFRQDWAHFLIRFSEQSRCRDELSQLLSSRGAETPAAANRQLEAVDVFSLLDAVASSDEDDAAASAVFALCEDGDGAPPWCALVLGAYKPFFESAWRALNERLLHDESPWRSTLQSWVERAKTEGAGARGGNETRKLMGTGRLQNLHQRVAAALLAQSRGAAGSRGATAKLHATLIGEVVRRFAFPGYANVCIRAFCTFRSRGRRKR
jgi:hypothetical protein